MSTLTPIELRTLDRAHHLHPFTDHASMHGAGTHIITRAEGCHVFDIEGRRLLDGLAGLWCVNVGYNRPEIAAAIQEQLGKLCYYPSFFNSTTEPAIALADKLAQLAPPRLTHSVFTNSGSEANETALKIIRNYWNLRGRKAKSKIITRTYAYHGVTIATTSMTGLVGCQTPFDLPLPGFIQVPGPYHYSADTALSPEAYGQWCLEQTEETILREGADTIAAIFAEPIQGAGGVIVPPPGYLAALREMARRHDILFVADEVISGFGRLGDWTASSLWNLDPDLICLAKGITSGYIPLGATLVSAEIAETLVQGGYFAHGFTYSGHPVACAAALANIDILEKENLIPRVRDDIGPYFQSKLSEFASHPAVGEVRGYQLIAALEVLPAGGKAELSQHTTLGAKAAALIREQGVIVRGIRNLIAVSPPLTISHPEVDELCAGIRAGLDRLWD
jgi:putrescine---pyruvate transaminase